MTNLKRTGIIALAIVLFMGTVAGITWLYNASNGGAVTAYAALSQQERLDVMQRTGGDREVTEGSEIKFELGNYNDVAYTWYKDGVAVAGQTGYTFVIPSATPADAGTYHAVLSETATANTTQTKDWVVKVTAAQPTATPAATTAPTASPAPQATSTPAPTAAPTATTAPAAVEPTDAPSIDPTLQTIIMNDGFKYVKFVGYDKDGLPMWGDSIFQEFGLPMIDDGFTVFSLGQPVAPATDRNGHGDSSMPFNGKAFKGERTILDGYGIFTVKRNLSGKDIWFNLLVRVREGAAAVTNVPGTWNVRESLFTPASDPFFAGGGYSAEDFLEREARYGQPDPAAFAVVDLAKDEVLDVVATVDKLIADKAFVSYNASISDYLQ